MKTLKYLKEDSTYGEIEYDENAPCVGCGKPVLNASCGGIDICPACDGGEIWNGSIYVRDIRKNNKKLEAKV